MVRLRRAKSAGGLRRQRHHMALHRSVHSGEGLAALPDEPAELPHQPEVAAAMSGELSALLPQVDDLFGFAEAPQGQRVLLHVPLHLSQGAGRLDGAVAVLGEGGHGEGGVDVVGELQVHCLVVHHIVVAVEHTAAIGSRPQGRPDFLLVGLAGQHAAGPGRPLAPDAGAGVRDVDFFRVIGAFVLAFAPVQAPRGRPLRGVLRPEIVQGAEALHPQAGLPRQPAENIHIVAALCQNHGAGLVRPAPIAPDEAVGLVPVGHVLDGVDGLQLADLPPAQQGLQSGVKPGVPQHMAHHHRPARLTGLFPQGAALLQAGGDGLFQQDMIPLVQRRQGGGDVLAVLGGHDHHIGQPGLGQQGLVGGEAPLRPHAVPLPQHSQTLRAAVRPGDDLHLLRVRVLIGGVGLQAPGPAAADGKGDGL